MKKDVCRYRLNEVLIQLFKHAENYSGSDKWQHPKLFAEEVDGMRQIWEYTNMMILECGGEIFLGSYPRDKHRII